jgi:type I restriction enzyme S subunit
MIEFKKYKLGDLGFFFGGVTSIKPEDYGFGTPFLPYKNVYKNPKVNVNELELMNVRPQDVERRSAIYGDIFFTASSETPDEVAMSSVLLDNVENLTFNGFCKRFRLNNFNTLLPEYARYLFRDISFRREVYQLATGDIRFNISQESLANIKIEIPDIHTQKEIAQILTSLDDKIELNLEMNQTIETMAQAMFKEWLVNFNFPGFDGELENGLPKGWRMKKLSDVIEVKHGYAFKGEFFSDLEEENILLTPGNFKIGGGFNSVKFKYYSGEIPKDYILKRNDLIVTMTDLSKAGDTLGYSALVPTIEGKTLLHNQRIGKVLIKSELPLKFYLYLVMRQDSYRHFVLGSATGSTVKHTSPTRICEYEFLLPDESTLLSFETIFKGLSDKQQENEFQNNNLTQARDTLLPKLMSGQIAFV